jgi:hypothetical protein
LGINFDELAAILDGDEFEETPVELEEFCYSERFLALPQLSEYQITCLRAMTQVYKKDTLIRWLGEEEGLKRYKQTNKEVILQLGKGSGKDFMSTIAVSYVVYLLLCLRDPAAYYGKPSGNAIDILNIAINSQQAKNVFFKGLRERVEKCPWFLNGPKGRRFNVKAESIEFNKNITCHSGHSEREAWEGYNVIMVILDEISGFALDSTSGHSQAKTASDIHKMYKASVSSRFAEFGKVLLLSFPRFRNDYIQQMYDKAVASKTIFQRSETLILNEELPEDSPNNRITIEWEEDHIESYTMDRTFAMRRPSWEMNPTMPLDGLKGDFFTDMIDSLSRFACMPPDAVDGFFRNRAKVETAFSNDNIAVDESGQFAPWFVPDENITYYIHVDLAQKHDHCVVAMAHVNDWTASALYQGGETTVKPSVVVDMIMYWTPSKTNVIALDTVRDFILEVYHKGFNIGLVTFDRWNSTDIINELTANGLPAELLSVKKAHYQDFHLMVSEERVKGPYLPLLIDEMMSLRLVKDKVDHPRTGSNDLSDATCGAIANAIKYTPPDWDGSEIKVVTLDDFRNPPEKPNRPGGVIEAPRLDPGALDPSIIEHLEALRVI